jgi:acylphosphatase
MACEHAKALGLKGFVRNLPNGSVELEAEGEEDALNRFLLWCQHGPPGARVDNVNMVWRPPDQTDGEFVVTS